MIASSSISCKTAQLGYLKRSVSMLESTQDVDENLLELTRKCQVRMMHAWLDLRSDLKILSTFCEASSASSGRAKHWRAAAADDDCLGVTEHSSTADRENLDTESRVVGQPSWPAFR